MFASWRAGGRQKEASEFILSCNLITLIKKNNLFLLIIRIYCKNISWINPKRWMGFLIRSRKKQKLKYRKTQVNQTLYQQQMVRLQRSSQPMREAAASRLRWLSEAGGEETDLYQQSWAAPEAPARRPWVGTGSSRSSSRRLLVSIFHNHRQFRPSLQCPKASGGTCAHSLSHPLQQRWGRTEHSRQKIKLFYICCIVLHIATRVF